jgi:hypothetical protein
LQFSLRREFCCCSSCSRGRVSFEDGREAGRSTHRDDCGAAMSFAVSMALGATLLAAWLDWRFDKRRPASAMRRMGHAAAAFALLQIAVAGFQYLAGETAPADRRLAVVFILLLPSLVYCLLTSLWLTRTLAEMVGPARR